MPLDLKQAMRNRAWQPPTPDQEALQEPLFSPSDVGNAAKMGAVGLKGAMMAAPVLVGMAKYQVTDNHTGHVIGLYNTLKRASHKADKLDNEYGAVRYSTKRVEDKDIPGPSSTIALKPNEMDPNRYQTVRSGGKGKSYEDSTYPVATDLRIEYPGNVFDDGLKGLNAGHALRRAADNWPDATEVRIIGKQSLKDQMKPKP